MFAPTRQQSLKRKAATQDENAVEQPRKLPAIAEADTNQPLRTTRAAASRLGKGPPPLTKPRAPPLTSTTTRRTERATSAPPKSIAATRPPPASRPVAGRPTRTASNTIDDKRFQVLHDKVASIETARAADASRLAMEMEAERTKVAELHANQLAMSQQLAIARTQEMAQRRELDSASDEIDQLRRRHTRELEDLDVDLRRKDREIRSLRDELSTCQDDLQRERETVAGLKATLSHQSTAQVALSTQLSAMQAQHGATQAQLDGQHRAYLDVTIELEAARKRITELEHEARESETLRRKLHNQVQELKGNIRVFCRVRPLLSSDISSYPSPSSSINSPADSPDPDVDAILREQAKARMLFPDKMDHKEIVLSSSSESATGQERKDDWMFSFDRVREGTFMAGSLRNNRPTGFRASLLPSRGLRRDLSASPELHGRIQCVCIRVRPDGIGQILHDGRRSGETPSNLSSARD